MARRGNKKKGKPPQQQSNKRISSSSNNKKSAKRPQQSTTNGGKRTKEEEDIDFMVRLMQQDKEGLSFTPESRKMRTLLLLAFAFAGAFLLFMKYMYQQDAKKAAESSSSSLSKGPSFDVRPFRTLDNIAVADFEAQYAGSEVALPTLFRGTTGDVFRPEDWTRPNLYAKCGASPLVQPERDPQCKDPDTAKKDARCHHVRIVHESLVGKTWGGTTVADLKDDLPMLNTVRGVLEIQDRSPHGHEMVLFDAPLLHHCPSLKNSVRVPKYFPRDYYLLLDWLRGDNPKETRNWPSIIVSKKGGGTFLHADSGMTRFWAQQLSGRKRWRVFPRHQGHKLAPSQQIHYYYPVLFELDAFHPDFAQYPDANGATVYEAVTEPGDLIFIPEGWAHQVQNLEDAVITSMNFLDNHAVETAARELSYRYNFYTAHSANLFSAFFFPLDNPVNDDGNTNIPFDAYFTQRFLNLETNVPQSVVDWVERGGATAIDTEWDALGLPALHVAIFYNYFVVAQYLIEVGGANVNVVCARGLSALDFAEGTGRWGMRDWLRYQYNATGRLGQGG